MEKILKNKLKKSLKELCDTLESQSEYCEKRQDIALGSIMTLTELIKEMK